jgi:hypothetical protein
MANDMNWDRSYGINTVVVDGMHKDPFWENGLFDVIKGQLESEGIKVY